MEKYPRLRLHNGAEYRFSACGDVPWTIVARLADAMCLEFREPSERQKQVSVVLRHPWVKHPQNGVGRIEASVVDPGEDGTFLALQLMRIASVVARDAEGRGGVLLHGALVEREGYGYLLAGPGGVGKTTATRRLPRPWRPLCDDATLVVRGPGGNYQAHPWPTWSRFMFGGGGGCWDVEPAVPLQGIFFLAQDDEDRARPLGAGRSANLLVEAAEQISPSMFGVFDKEVIRAFRLRRFDNICRLARAVPGFELRLSLKGAFWYEMERVAFSIQKPIRLGRWTRHPFEMAHESA